MLAECIGRCKQTDVEYVLCLHLLPLPVDQRYNESDMKRIMNLM